MKKKTKPVERMSNEPLPLRMAPRCLARARSEFNEFSRAERDEFEEHVLLAMWKLLLRRLG